MDEHEPGGQVEVDGNISYGDLFDVYPVARDPDWAGIGAIRDHWLILDSTDRAAALVPPVGGGRAQTREERWDLTVEHRRFGWLIAAHSGGSGRLVATARPALRPRAYKLEVYPRIEPGWFDASRLQLAERRLDFTARRSRDCMHLSRR
jgi:hypothetical protein